MYCPETIFICNNFLYVRHNGKGDVRWKWRPRQERYNIFRWEIGIFRKRYGGYRIKINEKGRANIILSNFIWSYLGGEKRHQHRYKKEIAERDARWAKEDAEILNNKEG